jgi:hypothetical protein
MQPVQNVRQNDHDLINKFNHLMMKMKKEEKMLDLVKM